MATAIYAGSFDPITNGHVWVIKQALKMFDKVCVAIAVNPEKKTTFSTEDKKQMILNAFPNETKIEVIDFHSQFLVNVCRENNIDVSIRGIRNVKDFEYEKQIQDINERINPNVQTVYLVPPNDLAGLSSSVVKGLVGNSEWQFVVQDMIPRINMPYMTRMAYSVEKTVEHVTKSIYYLAGNDCVLGDVITSYNSVGRYYHTMQHINEMFELSRRMYPTDYNLLNIAILFHDVVYNPLSKTNEEDSVKLFESYDFKISKAHAKTIKDLIMVTKTHQTNGDYLQDLMCDLDLAILGSDVIRFNEYERQIRHEYLFATDEQYKAGRIEFIKKILARNTIFLTSEFQRLFEEKARENLNKLKLVMENKNG